MNMKKISVLLVVFVAILSTIFAYYTSQLQFDYDFEKFFPENDEETRFYKNFRDQFTTDNDFIIIAVENESGVFDSTFLSAFEKYAQSINALELVDTVIRITQMKEVLSTSYSPMPFQRKYIDLERSDSSLIKDSIRIFERPELVDAFINQKATTLAMMVRHQPFLSKRGCEKLVENIETIDDQFNFDKIYKAGRAVGQVYYVDKMMREMIRAVAMSFLLVVVFLLLTFRSLWGLWIPIIVVLLSFLWITGAMGLIDAKVNLILTILPTIMFVVAMSDVIHLVSKFLEELRNGLDKKNALKKAYREVGLATLLTSVTTSVGFLSLLFVNVQPVQIFGIYTALGVMLAFVLAYTLLPALLYLSPLPRLIHTHHKNTFWGKFLPKAFLFTIRNPFKILIGTLCIVIVSAWGTFQVQANNFLLDDLRADDPMKQEFSFFDKNLGGVRPFELAYIIKDTSLHPLDYEMVQMQARVDSFLLNDYGLTKINSLASTVKVINRSKNAGNPAFYKIPNEKDYQPIKRQFQTILNDTVSNPFRMMIDPMGKYLRSFSTVGDYGNKDISKRNERLNQFLAHNIDTNKIEVKVTGTAHLVDRNMKYLSYSLVEGLLLALGVVAIIMGLLYKSFKMVFIALIPNVIPLVMIAAVMGFLGIDLKVTTSIIFTIGFGIAVDDTIHFMSKLRLELQKGRSLIYALKRTYLSTGRAIIITSLILSAGFFLLVFSKFLGTFYVGILISLILAFAVIADLLVLPVLVYLFYRPQKKGHSREQLSRDSE